MKRLLLAGLIVVMFAPAAQADGMGLTIGVEGAFVLPVGDWGDASGIGLGGMVKGAYNLTDEMSLALRVGYIYHLAKDLLGVDVSSSELPILVGFRYTMPFGLFGELSVGMVNYGVSVGDASDSEMKFGLLAGAGFTTMGLNFGVNFFAPSIGDIGDIMGLLFVVGYDFITF